jgi:hypothetical protein
MPAPRHPSAKLPSVQDSGHNAVLAMISLVGFNEVSTIHATGYRSATSSSPAIACGQSPENRRLPVSLLT